MYYKRRPATTSPVLIHINSPTPSLCHLHSYSSSETVLICTFYSNRATSYTGCSLSPRIQKWKHRTQRKHPVSPGKGLRGFLNLRTGEITASRTAISSFTSLHRHLLTKGAFAPEGLRTKWDSEGREEACSPSPQKTLHPESLLAPLQQQHTTLSGRRHHVHEPLHTPTSGWSLRPGTSA